MDVYLHSFAYGSHKSDAIKIKHANAPMCYSSLSLRIEDFMAANPDGTI